MPRFDVLTMGRSSIDLYAHEIGVPITAVTSFDAYVGGCPTNISVGTRRLGLKSVLLTAVGDDQVADFVLGFLDREGVDTRFVPRKLTMLIARITFRRALRAKAAAAPQLAAHSSTARK